MFNYNQQGPQANVGPSGGMSELFRNAMMGSPRMMSGMGSPTMSGIGQGLGMASPMLSGLFGQKRPVPGPTADVGMGMQGPPPDMGQGPAPTPNPSMGMRRPMMMPPQSQGQPQANGLWGNFSRMFGQ